MNKNIVGIIIAVVVLGAVGGFVVMNKESDSPASTQSADQAHTESEKPNESTSAKGQIKEVTETNTVNIVDFKGGFDFEYAKIRVKKGSTVKWINQSTTRHDVNPTSESADFKGSELLGKGESYEATFNTVGTFQYNCTPHPFMKGSVEVVE